jgi:MFS transporter, DHA1 family, tetracycline resistance protein
VIQGGLLHRLVRRFGEPTLVAGGYAANAAGLAVLAFAPVGALVWLGCAAVAVGSSLATPSLSSLISRGAGADHQGAVLGVNQSLGALARAAGPAAGGLLYAGWFRGGAFLAGSLLMAGAMAAAWPIARRAAAR